MNDRKRGRPPRHSMASGFFGPDGDREEPEEVEIPDPLTPRQREAVETALELGYYEVPANVKMADIADEMGCSRQTVGELLRRAHGAAAEAVVEGVETASD